MSYREIVAAQLERDEGRRRKPYRDSVGKWTAGVGRNLDDREFSDDEIDLMRDNDLDQAERDCRLLVPAFDGLTENRKAAVLNMAFNLGFRRFSQFLETLRHINAQQWEAAAAAMLDSLWAKQVGKRAERLATMMREG